MIAYILKQKNNSSNFVTLESSTENAMLLECNKIKNNFDFHVENSALSKKKMIQKKGRLEWVTVILEDDDDTEIDTNQYYIVNTMSYTELCQKYNINFDTLIIDCEGAFYYILKEMPEILENINLLIIENDYPSKDYKIYVDDILKQNNFCVDYMENAYGIIHFYEVWKRK